MSLSDILQSLPAAKGGGLCELGKIKIGGKKKEVRASAGGGTWRAPEKYDHFVLTTMNRDSTGDLIIDKPLMDELIGTHGDPDGKLRRIPVRLLSDDLDDVLQSAFVWYGGKTVGARSDGKEVTWFNNPEPGPMFGKKYPEPVVQPWTSQDLDWKNPKNGTPLFKTHSVFNCVIASKEARWGGIYKFRTTSVISLRQLHGSLVHLQQLTGGILVGMPLNLVIRPMQVAPEGKPTTVYVVHVELRGGDLQQLQQSALETAKFRLAFADQIQKTQRQYKQLIAMPGTEADDEAADIQDEFQPESVEIETVPAGQSHGLLDDDEPQQQTQTDPTPELPTTNQAIENGDEGSPPIDEKAAERIAIQEAIEQGFVNVKASLYEMAKADRPGRPGVSRSAFDPALTRWALAMGMKGKEDQIPHPKLAELWLAVKAGAFDWVTGKINQVEQALS